MQFQQSSKMRFSIISGVFTVAMFALLQGCSFFEKPTVPQEKFIFYYIDMLSMQDSLGTDTQSSKKIIAALNQKYLVTEEQVQNTLQQMSQEPKQWEKFFEKVNEELTKRARFKAPVSTAPATTTPPAAVDAGHAVHEKPTH
ncbi:MAG: hypothetical protein HY965_02975 [Ignavibacteriales bacterium]|nr:hypothetical protein [Ignavibacteriales bacterium]